MCWLWCGYSHSVCNVLHNHAQNTDIGRNFSFTGTWALFCNVNIVTRSFTFHFTWQSAWLFTCRGALFFLVLVSMREHTLIRDLSLRILLLRFSKGDSGIAISQPLHNSAYPYIVHGKWVFNLTLYPTHSMKCLHCFLSQYCWHYCYYMDTVSPVTLHFNWYRLKTCYESHPLHMMLLSQNYLRIQILHYWP
jgi:hypothetical protein